MIDENLGNFTNYPKIRHMELELQSQEKAWDQFFATKPAIEVMTMDYETLAADYRAEVARVLAFMGEDPPSDEELPAPRMVRQSDATSEEWHRRMDDEFPVW